MARFIVRRLLAMLGVLFAISDLTFLIFQAIPNGDPTVRLGGRTSTPETRAAIRKDWGGDPQGVGLRKADLRAVRDHDGQGVRRLDHLLPAEAQRRGRDQARSAGNP